MKSSAKRVTERCDKSSPVVGFQNTFAVTARSKLSSNCSSVNLRRPVRNSSGVMPSGRPDGLKNLNTRGTLLPAPSAPGSLSKREASFSPMRRSASDTLRLPTALVGAWPPVIGSPVSGSEGEGESE